MTKKSSYHKAIEFLTNEFRLQYEEGYNTEEEYTEAVAALAELSASEVMQMYKAWKDD